MAEKQTAREVAEDQLLDRYLDKMGWSAERWTLTGEDSRAYGHNIVSALDSYLSLVVPDARRRYEDISDTKPDVENREVDIYHLFGVDRDRLEAQHTQHPAQFLDQLLRLRNQTKLLFDHYDEVKCSAETGLPLYRGVKSFRGVQKDAETLEEQLNEVQDTYDSWACDIDAADRIPLPEDGDSSDFYADIEQLAEAEKELFWHQVHVSLQSGDEPPRPDELDWPDRLAGQARYLDYLRKADTIDPVTPVRIDENLSPMLIPKTRKIETETASAYNTTRTIEIEREMTSSSEAEVGFSIEVSDFSPASDDRFLHYVIEGCQMEKEDSSMFGLLDGVPPIKEEKEGYSLSNGLEHVVKDAIGFPPKNLYGIWTALDEKYDLNQGDRIQPTKVELRTVGPMYTAANRPVSADVLLHKALDEHAGGDIDAFLEDTRYDNIFEFQDELHEAFLEDNPRQYAGLQIGQFLEDNPEEFVFMVETERYTEDKTENDIVLLTSNASALTEYVPDAFDGEMTNITAWVVDVPETKPLPDRFMEKGETQ